MLRLLALSLTLTATVCLAADKKHSYVPNDESSGKNDSQLSLVMKELPEQLPPLLVSEGWREDKAKAFALGLALGKQCKKEECSLLTYVEFNGFGLCMSVVMKNLRSAISANLEWKEGNQTYNPFAELFDLKEIQNSKYYNDDEATYLQVRSLFAMHAKNATAMVVIDVALLKGLVHAIGTKPEDILSFMIEEDIIMSVCALSMIPLIGEHCKDDILTVLDTVKMYTVVARHFSVPFTENYISSLVTLFKLLEDGPIRNLVENIAINSRPESVWDILNTRMLLGPDHRFVKKFETFFSEDDEGSSLKASLQHQQDSYHCQVYSIGYSCIHTFSDSISHSFMNIFNSTLMKGSINRQANSLKWDHTMPISRKQIRISNKKTYNDSFNYLFVISVLPAPYPFWRAIASCASMSEFNGLIREPSVRQVIITYGITILESRTSYRVTLN